MIVQRVAIQSLIYTVRLSVRGYLINRMSKPGVAVAALRQEKAAE